ncbi:MAG: hypothetical protein NW215_03475 [Hyphomicrobiales bacterium]|nr:hypothetical protein [Hyphomicrobiales bacterium]
MKLTAAFLAMMLAPIAAAVAQPTAPMPNPLRPEERTPAPPTNDERGGGEREERGGRDDADDFDDDAPGGMWRRGSGHHGKWGKPHQPKGAHFKFMKEDSEIDIKCAPAEPTAACVDAAIRLMDKLREAKEVERR